MISRFILSACSAAVLLGPPSIRVEAVSDPAAAPVKGALFMVTGRHHMATDGFTVTGRAEGLVAGKRVTHELVMTPAGSPGVYGVLKQWDAGKPWVLVFTVHELDHGDTGFAEGVVRIASDGRVQGIDYPMGKLAQGSPWPRRVGAAEIDEALVRMSGK